MSAPVPGPTPAPVRLPPAEQAPDRGVGLDPARVRAWLAATTALLLVLLYVVVELTYSSTHLPPARYGPVAEGAVGEGPWADFRLLSVQQTERWGEEVGGDPGSAEPGAVWVVARLEVTPRVARDYVLCTMTLVATDGRSWSPVDLPPQHEGESCAPDPEDVTLGTTYPFVLGFQVPADETSRIAGLAVETYSGRRYPLLRPPA